MDAKRSIVAAREHVYNGWLILDYAGHPIVRLDGRVLDRVMSHDDNLELSIHDLAVRLTIVNGSELARLLSEDLAPFTRLASIRSEEQYNDARRRLSRIEAGEWIEPFLFVGDQPVLATSEVIAVGSDGFYVSQALELAAKGLPLTFANGAIIHAALALLPVAAIRHPESIEILRRRIKEYESAL